MTTRNKEHVKDECWCGHSAEKHRWDAARDWREYECVGCNAEAKTVNDALIEAASRYPEHDQPGRDDFVAGARWAAARYRDEAMVERVAEALVRAAMEHANEPPIPHMARAALAVIAEPQ